MRFFARCGLFCSETLTTDLAQSHGVGYVLIVRFPSAGIADGAHQSVRIRRPHGSAASRSISRLRMPPLSQRSQGRGRAIPPRGVSELRRLHMGRRRAVRQLGSVHSCAPSGDPWSVALRGVRVFDLDARRCRRRLPAVAEFDLIERTASRRLAVPTATGALDHDDVTRAQFATPFGRNRHIVDGGASRCTVRAARTARWA